jgi:hypothetical protein
LHPDFTHVLCLTEHHFEYSQLNVVHIENYNLGAYYCRRPRDKGGVDVVVRSSLCFSSIVIIKHSVEQDIEICDLKLSFGILNICELTFYRGPSGNFSHSLLKLDAILQILYTPTLHIVICGDININYLMESKKKNHLDSLLLLYTLTRIINFPKRVQNTSATYLLHGAESFLRS